MIVTGLFVLAAMMAQAAEPTLVAKVKKDWRAQDGETAEQIFAKVSKVAHFVPRGWEVAKTGSGDEVVVFSWAKHSSEKTGDEYTITWEVASDGTMTLGPPYAKPMELGWQAFALSLVASEVSEEEKNPNLRFLHDLSNFNFVTTAQGKLGDLLKRGRCAITNDPVHVTYLPPTFKVPETGDLWAVHLQVDCDIPGPAYFTRGGVVLFDRRGKEDWKPASVFARRIANHPPGSWFDRPEP
ncbi:nodulate formation efficiency C protein [Bradyrhizobium sp. 170]|nr:nodulate formation efficiency C protein [Bradyrhizobium sp. 170]